MAKRLYLTKTTLRGVLNEMAADADASISMCSQIEELVSDLAARAGCSAEQLAFGVDMETGRVLVVAQQPTPEGDRRWVEYRKAVAGTGSSPWRAPGSDRWVADQSLPSMPEGSAEIVSDLPAWSPPVPPGASTGDEGV